MALMRSTPAASRWNFVALVTPTQRHAMLIVNGLDQLLQRQRVDQPRLKQRIAVLENLSTPIFAKTENSQ